MFYQTHKLVGQNIDYIVKLNTGIQLNTNNLIWGSIKPDFVPSLFVMKHYMDESIDFVIDKILNIIYSVNKICSEVINNISMAIGVISHFLSDFFCLPHSERWEFFKNNTIEHIKYENKLQNVASKYQQISVIRTPQIINITREEIFSFINNLYNEYKQKTGYQNDITNAINISSAVAVFIINNMFKINNEKLTYI